MVEKKPEGDLKTVFLIFTAQKADMDQKQFVKLCKETRIFDAKLKASDIDTIYPKHANKKTSKITYEGFQKILTEFGKIKGITFDELSGQILAKGIPMTTKSDQ